LFEEKRTILKEFEMEINITHKQKCIQISLKMRTFHENLKEMKEELYRGINGRTAPSEYATKIIDMLDGYNGMGNITNELYDLLQYAYNEQRGFEPAYK